MLSLQEKPVLSQAKPRDAAINLNKQLIDIWFSCLTVQNIENNTIIPQHVQNGRRHKRNMAVQDHSRSSVICSGVSVKPIRD